MVLGTQLKKTTWVPCPRGCHRKKGTLDNCKDERLRKWKKAHLVEDLVAQKRTRTKEREL